MRRTSRHSKEVKNSKLGLEINKVYESIKESKEFNVYYFALHDLLKEFFTKEYLQFHKALPYPDFDEEMVEDFLLDWSRHQFSLKAREKKKKPYKTLIDKLSGDDVKRISHYLNKSEYRKVLQDFDKYNVPLDGYYHKIIEIPNNVSRFKNLDEIVSHEINKYYCDNYFIEDELNFNIYMFIALFLGSFDIEYVSNNYYFQLTKEDFIINSLKCKVMDIIRRIERRLNDETD